MASFAELRKVALNRIDDAFELLELPTWEPDRSDAAHRHLRASAYLAGYSVECSVKSFLIAKGVRSTRGGSADLDDAEEALRLRFGVQVSLKSASAHDLARLYAWADRLQRAEEGVRSHRNATLIWRHTWRYDATPLKRELARQFVEACASVTAYYRAQV